MSEIKFNALRECEADMQMSTIMGQPVPDWLQRQHVHIMDKQMKKLFRDETNFNAT